MAGCIDLRFGDESGFSLLPSVPYGWSKVGEQLGIQSSRSVRINVFGLLNLGGELTSFVTEKAMRSQTIIDCLDSFAETIEKMTVVVLDNAPWHISKKIEEKIKQWEEKGVIIFYLPSYSPHLNIIETLWRKMKLEWLKPKDYKNKKNYKRRYKIFSKIMEIRTTTLTSQ
ncbi:IS630 family transposase [Bernardetia sp.]|uniref:IS630 family transposase n=1 Tax=Bernardetia sp. TaxID=1937974 RepID=UPI0025C5C955|nr:IS630 family transposase [Bernardetia sp.]